MKLPTRSRRGSSLVYLGLSTIAFCITYGLIWFLIPEILGSFFSAMPPVANATWQAMNVKTQNIIMYIIPLSASFGIFMLALKVLMNSTVKGAD